MTSARMVPMAVGGLLAAVVGGSVVALASHLASETDNGLPVVIPYEGTLESSGTPVDGQVQLAFELWDAATGGTSLWASGNRTVTATRGHFSVVLGAGNPTIPRTLFTDHDEVFVSVSVNNEELNERQVITPVPYALRAAAASDFRVDGQLTINGSQVLNGPFGALRGSFTEGVTLGDDARTCSPAVAGTVRYATGTLLLCNGVEWKPLGAPTSYVTEGLLMHVNARDPRSYPGRGNMLFDLSGSGLNMRAYVNLNVSGGIVTVPPGAGYMRTDRPVILPNNAFTVELAIRVPTFVTPGTSGECPLQHEGPTNTHQRLHLCFRDTTSRIEWDEYNASVYSSSVAAGEEHLLTFVHESTNTPTLYLDGANVGTFPPANWQNVGYGGDYSWLTMSASSFGFGLRALRLYGVGLTAAQVSSNYAAYQRGE